MTRTTLAREARAILIPLALMGAFAVLFAVDGCEHAAHAAVDGPAVAAAPAVEAAPSVFATVVLPAIVHVLTDPTFLAALGGLLMFWLRSKSAARADKVQSAIDMAFHVVEDLKATGKLPANLDKPTAALGQLHAILAVQGVTATDAEITLAKAAWSALHGQQAPVAVAPVVAPPVVA